MITQENVVPLFLRDWLKWAEEGYLHYSTEPRFSKRNGLCSAYIRWCTRHQLSEEFTLCFREWLIADFDEDADYPFPDFSSDVALSLIHKNPHRLAWVRKVLKENAVLLNEYDRSKS